MSKRDDRMKNLMRMAPWIGVSVLVAGALIMGLRLGVPAAILWFAFAALAGAILLFWEALRSVLDPDASTVEADEIALATGEMFDLEARKRTALKALKDVDFEHSIGRMSDEDHKSLREKYRAEARDAMALIDRGLGAYLTEAQEQVAKAAKIAAEKVAKKSPAPAPSAEESEEPSEEEASAAESAETESDEQDDEASAETATASESADAKSTETAVDHRDCPSCNTRNDADAVFCKKCAARLMESPS